MPSGKIRPISENYSNFGGINIKASQYLTGPQEFLDLINFDFQSPGNLTKRWGTTQYISGGYTAAITGLVEFEQTSGFSQIIFSYTGGIQAGATTTTQQGLSFNNVGWTMEQIIGPNSLQIGTTAVPLRNAFTFSARTTYFRNGTFIFAPALMYSEPATLDGAPYDFENYNNTLFGANGTNFIKYQGTTTSRVFIPQPTRSGATGTGGATITNFGITQGISLAGASGIALQSQYGYAFVGTYLNLNSYESEAGPIVSVPLIAGATSALFFGASSANYQTAVLVNVPLNWGITAINVYGVRDLTGTSFGVIDFGSTTGWLNSYRLLTTQAVAGGATQSWVYLGAPLAGGTFLWDSSNLLDINQKFTFGQTNYPPNVLDPNTLPSGISFLTNNGLAVNGLIYNAHLAPKIIEMGNNRMFSAGYSGALSNVYFSELGIPDDIEASNFFEVRTNDGDIISGLKFYNESMYIFKRRSFHQLSGTDPNSFVLREVSDQYGCLSNRAVTTYENHMLFLDSKGVILFNGANIECISNKIQNIFETMNLPVAQDTATMIHDKQRNQILLGIPVNGASTNNLTVVYDYMVGAWTKYDGYNPSVYAMIKGRQSFKSAMFGDYSGIIKNFGPSLYGGDNGSAFTLLMTTRYLTDEGNSIQKMWRRLFLNDTTNGATNGYTINLRQDHGSSNVLTRTMNFSSFQTRMDFGIQSKSLSFELTNNSANFVQINGFVLEHRYLRNI